MGKRLFPKTNWPNKESKNKKTYLWICFGCKESIGKLMVLACLRLPL